MQNPHLETFLQQTTISRARTHLNQTLASYSCHIDASSVLVASIMAGDLIWTQSSHLPEKLTVFLMGKPTPSSKSLSQKDWLKLHLQESNNIHLDDDIIDKLSDFKFDYPRSINSLRHFLNNLVGICRLLFYGDSAISSKVVDWIDHLDQREMLYEMNFEVDPLFGLKVCLTIDRAIQLFLVSCQEATAFDKINFRYLDFSFDIECIEKGRFICNPPPPLLDLFSAASPLSNPSGVGKRKRNNALSSNRDEVTGGGGGDDLIQNEKRNEKWMLKDKEDYKSVFPRPIWTDNPPPLMNGSDKRCCPRWHNRGYCFKNCKRSHGILNNTTSSKYDVWQRKCRDDTK